MGYTKIRATVTNPRRSTTLELEFLVDTGAGYAVIPPSIASELGLERTVKTKATLANKTEVEADYSSAYIRLMDREAPVPVLLIDSPMPLLGAFTLQVLGLEVDPVKEELKPSRPFTLGLLASITTHGESTICWGTGAPISSSQLPRMKQCGQPM